MCAFTVHGDFNSAMLRFVTAQAGCITPQPGRVHFNLSAKAETRAAPAAFPMSPDMTPPAGAATAFDLDACWTMVAAIDLPERVVEVRK